MRQHKKYSGVEEKIDKETPTDKVFFKKKKRKEKKSQLSLQLDVSRIKKQLGRAREKTLKFSLLHHGHQESVLITTVINNVF